MHQVKGGRKELKNKTLQRGQTQNAQLYIYHFPFSRLNNKNSRLQLTPRRRPVPNPLAGDGAVHARRRPGQQPAVHLRLRRGRPAAAAPGGRVRGSRRVVGLRVGRRVASGSTQRGRRRGRVRLRGGDAGGGRGGGGGEELPAGGALRVRRLHRGQTGVRWRERKKMKFCRGNPSLSDRICSVCFRKILYLFLFSGNTVREILWFLLFQNFFCMGASLI